MFLILYLKQPFLCGENSSMFIIELVNLQVFVYSVSTEEEEEKEDENKSEEEPKSKKQRVESSSSPLKSPRGRPPGSGSEGSFTVYCQKHREKVLEEHPEFTEEMLEDFLKQLWCRLSQKQKLRYRSKFSASQGRF